MKNECICIKDWYETTRNIEPTFMKDKIYRIVPNGDIGYSVELGDVLWKGNYIYFKKFFFNIHFKTIKQLRKEKIQKIGNKQK